MFITHSYLKKFKNFTSFNDTTSILYIQEIDSLSLKIEGMIREMILLYDIDDSNSFYFDSNENFLFIDIFLRLLKCLILKR